MSCLSWLFRRRNLSVISVGPISRRREIKDSGGNRQRRPNHMMIGEVFRLRAMDIWRWGVTMEVLLTSVHVFLIINERGRSSLVGNNFDGMKDISFVA